MKTVLNMIWGFCMALADSVPGVSGGTIAFILGFYDKFINSLNDIISGNKEEKKQAAIFLIKLMLGWAIGFCLSVLILSKLFNSHIYHLSSLFLGLSAFAIPIIIRDEKVVLKEKYGNLIFTAIGVAIVTLITYFNPAKGSDSAVDISHLSIGLVFYLFFVAMIAISAMVLPGISGSTLLLIFGLYVPVIGGIKELLHLNFKYLPAIIIFGLGILAGICTVIKGVKLALAKQRSKTVYLILGLMIGSFYAIIMGPTTLDTPKPAMTWSSFHILFFLLGGVVLGGLELLSKAGGQSKEKKSDVE